MSHSANGGGFFYHWFLASTAGIRSPTSVVRLVKAHRENLRVWHTFFVWESFHGRALWILGPVSNFDMEIITDTVGSTGFGVFYSRVSGVLDHGRGHGLKRELRRI